MSVLSGIKLIKFIIVAGLAIWNLLEGIGLAKDFTGAQKMVGRIMNMELIEAPPSVSTALMNRRVSNPFWHKAGAVILITFNFVSALLLFVAVYSMVNEGRLATGNQLFLLWANYGLALFLCMSFAVSFVGLWFAYYIKHSELMVTHFVLIVLGMVAAGIVNFPG